MVGLALAALRFEPPALDGDVPVTPMPRESDVEFARVRLFGGRAILIAAGDDEHIVAVGRAQVLPQSDHAVMRSDVASNTSSLRVKPWTSKRCFAGSSSGLPEWLRS